MAFQAVEFEEGGDRLRERAHDPGGSILLPMVGTIRDVAADETVGQRHTIRGEPHDVEALLDHLRDQALTVEIEDDNRERGQRVVEFVKVSATTRDRIQHYLDGGTVDERIANPFGRGSREMAVQASESRVRRRHVDDTVDDPAVTGTC